MIDMASLFSHNLGCI